MLKNPKCPLKVTFWVFLTKKCLVMVFGHHMWLWGQFLIKPQPLPIKLPVSSYKKFRSARAVIYDKIKRGF